MVFDTMMNIAYIRYTNDTTSKFNQEEQDFFDANRPHYDSMTNKLYGLLVNSRFRTELEKRWGKQLFDIAECTIKTFSPEVIEDLQAENRLASEYTKLCASAKLNFDGKELNLSGITPYEADPDRATRKRAAEVRWGFFAQNADKFDEIYDKLVKVRHCIAQKLGYDNFVQLGYNRMLRTDYNADMIAVFRKQIRETVVPMAMRLRQRQAKRLGIDKLMHYDLSYNFKTGNPKPKGKPEWIVKHGKRMYEELSEQTGGFFNFMLNNELMDLVTRKGKSGGGYCTYVANYKSPYIFSNFNGTSHDINVLTHEAGHAFQVYMSRHFDLPEYNWPTYEACEIHSMSMEFFAWPWMEHFFEEDTQKFKFEHLNDSVLFLPYGVAVDDFQHYVYANPQATPDERKAAWRELEKTYLPWIDYGDNAFLEAGGYWQKQGHIFEMPFYYIDYTLAQICAFQFWQKATTNHQAAFEDYIRLCKAGGSQSFLKLVDYAHLNSPFDDGCVEKTLQPVEKWLDTVNDVAL